MEDIGLSVKTGAMALIGRDILSVRFVFFTVSEVCPLSRRVEEGKLPMNIRHSYFTPAGPWISEQLPLQHFSPPQTLRYISPRPSTPDTTAFGLSSANLVFSRLSLK